MREVYECEVCQKVYCSDLNFVRIDEKVHSFCRNEICDRAYKALCDYKKVLEKSRDELDRLWIKLALEEK